jgi:hypothetical protein
VRTSVNLGFVLAIIFSEIVPALIFLYAAYWAFEIRKALASPLRRNLALWQGAVGVIVAATTFLTYSNNFVISVILVVFYSVAFAVIFAYLDSIVKVARRSDPLLRNIIHWEKTRYVGWIGVGLIAVFNTSTLVLPSAQANLAGLLVEIFIPIPFVIGGAGVLVGSTRIKDPLLKGNLKWLGLTLAFATLTIIVAIVEALEGFSNYDIYYSYPALIAGAVDIVVGYCLYKSARSLAPISHFPLDEEKQNPTMP